MTTTATPHDDVLVLAISATEWRVSDPRRRDDDALCLVGFVQQVGDVFETTQIGRPRERHYFHTLQHAVDHLVANQD